MEKNEKLVLIDGNSLINRAFYALPLLSNSDGEFSNAVYGFCNILIKLIEQEKPKYMAVAFDMGHSTFRHEMYAEYKAGRKKMPNELASQLPLLKQVLSAMNIKFIEKQGIEADDIIGTLAKKFSTETIIVSGDRDLFQLVDDSNSVWFTKRGITDAVVVTPKNIKEVYGVNANQVVDLKALMGDSSDNIKGVAGVGEKTAKTLIETYGSLNNIYNNIENIKGKVNTNLITYKQDAYLSKQLATINTSADINVSLTDLEFDYPFKKQVFDIFAKYEFKSILKRNELFDINDVVIETKKVNRKFITNELMLDELIKSIYQTKYCAVSFDNNEIHFANSKFEENIIIIEQGLLNEGLNFSYVLEKIKPILQDDNIKKIALNVKTLKHILQNYNIELNGTEFDANLAMYLLSGSKKTDYLAKDYAEKYNYEAKDISACLYATKEELLKNLQSEDMTNLYFNIEFPLIDVLFEMEKNGFKIDIEMLNKIATEYTAELETLTRRIWEDAKQDFNINSPKQMAEILFDKLALKLPANMKKSTNVDVLERLIGKHPIIDKILRYRKIQKLYSTYIEPFKHIVDKKTGLIHTIFNQTLTATGRLSSSEPNLQNIPIRDEEGKNLRKIFIPRDPNGCIITCDYSQIELRLLAHYSNDAKLQYAYNNEIDIHSQTASDLFSVPINQITEQMRRDAKTVNFSIIYGISDYGLSVNLMSTRKQAKEMIDKYFENYYQVKEYMNRSIEKAKELGYVSTMFGRKRKIDEIKSSNYNTRQFGERAAMNMPLQGTASDIIKIAMINVINALKNNNLKSKLILQIHDELIVDCAGGEEEIVKDILKQQMENAVKLSIPLVVDIKSGKDWFEAK